MARIYVASSWRNPHQPMIVDLLRNNGHEVYDFRNPPHNTGFAWHQIGLALPCKAEDYRNALLTHPRAAQGFMSDFAAMRWADTCLLVLPCGRSAHLELGWMAGAGKRTLILTQDGEEPELMALLADTICINVEEVLIELRKGGMPTLPLSAIDKLELELKSLVIANPMKARLAALDDDTRMWFLSELIALAAGHLPLHEIEAMVSRHLPPIKGGEA